MSRFTARSDRWPWFGILGAITGIAVAFSCRNAFTLPPVGREMPIVNYTDEEVVLRQRVSSDFSCPAESIRIDWLTRFGETRANVEESLARTHACGHDARYACFELMSEHVPGYYYCVREPDDPVTTSGERHL
jgi:hypothetical protein